MISADKLSKVEQFRYERAVRLFNDLGFNPNDLELKCQGTAIGLKIWVESKTTPYSQEFYLDLTAYESW